MKSNGTLIPSDGSDDEKIITVDALRLVRSKFTERVHELMMFI